MKIAFAAVIGQTTVSTTINVIPITVQSTVTTTETLRNTVYSTVTCQQYNNTKNWKHENKDMLNIFNNTSISKSASLSSQVESLTSSTPAVETKDNINYEDQFRQSSNVFLERFGKVQGNKYLNSNDENCNSAFKDPALWDLAVAAKSVIKLENIERLTQILNQIYIYENKALGAFAASTLADEDIYTDDNAQIAWVFIDAYKLTKKTEYLSSAESIVKFLMKEVDKNGGVIWKYKHNYIASISTSEAALAAIRLYEVNGDEKLIQYSKSCMEFMFKYFEDSSDHTFYDGLNKDDYSDLNRGKLTYTVGTTLSTLSILNRYDTKDWKSNINRLIMAVTDTKGVFYNSNGYWNNAMKYIHLLYIGLKDVKVAMGLSDLVIQEIKKQGGFINNYLKDNDHLYFNSIGDCTKEMTKIYDQEFNQSIETKEVKTCKNNIAKKSLIDNGSVLQILDTMNSFYI